MAKGGPRPGSGRKKGTLNKETLEKLRVAEHLRQRTLRVADVLFESQLSLARGQSFLYRIDKVWVESGKKGWWKSKKPVLVTDPEEISNYLEGLYEDGEEDNGGASYYYITAKEPNSQTIDSMFNRALGKAPISLEHSGPEGAPIAITGVEVVIRK